MPKITTRTPIIDPALTRPLAIAMALALMAFGAQIYILREAFLQNGDNTKTEEVVVANS